MSSFIVVASNINTKNEVINSTPNVNISKAIILSTFLKLFLSGVNNGLVKHELFLYLCNLVYFRIILSILLILASYIYPFNAL